MKKNLFILVLCVFFASTSFAQMKFGVTAGLNGAGLVYGGDYNEETAIKNTLICFQAGLVFDLGFTENISIVPELLFSQRGAFQKFEQIDNKQNTQSIYLTFNYLQLPVNLAFKFNAGRSSKMSIFAGPYVGYMISAEHKTETDWDGEKETETEKFEIGSNEDQLKALDYGVNAGLGFHWGNGMFLKLQYNMGLNSILNVSNPTYKNRNIALTLGFMF